MSLNTIIIPTARLHTLLKVVDTVTSQKGGIQKTYNSLTNNLVANQYLFLQLALTSTFLSNMIILMDLPHQFWLMVARAGWCYKRNPGIDELVQRLTKEGKIT